MKLISLTNKTTGKIFAGFVLGISGPEPTWTSNPDQAVTYTETQFAKFQTIRGSKKFLAFGAGHAPGLEGTRDYQGEREEVLDVVKECLRRNEGPQD